MPASTIRSLLYLPASKPRMLDKLAGLASDAVILDLEDGVARGAKAAARQALRACDLRRTLAKLDTWMVRVNVAGSEEFQEDLQLIEEIEVPRVVLPKAETEREVELVAERVGAWGAKVGLMVETARGLANVRTLACHPAVDLLIYGAADFRLSLGARPDPDRTWERHALFEILLAARANGCQAIDSVYFRFRDGDGLARAARVSREMGFDGKTCIHPCQIETIHDVFSSTAEEAEWAREVLRVWEAQDGPHAGVVTLGDEMIEELHVVLARRILSRAGQRS